MPQLGHLLGFYVYICTANPFLGREAITLQGVLHEYFVSKTVPKCGYLIDFFATYLPAMHAYTHACCWKQNST